MVVSIVANEIFYAIVGALIPSVGEWPGTGPGPIIVVSIFLLLIASVVFAAVVRFSLRPVRTYWFVATIALVITFALPIGAGAGFGGRPGTPPADTATVITLLLMHVIAYAISVPMFTRLTRAP